MRDVAVVKALVTGTDIKLTMNPTHSNKFVKLDTISINSYFFFFVNIQPKFKIPISNSTHPAKNASTTANSGGLSIVYCNVSSAIKLVGPIDTSLIVPKNIYVKAPKLKRKKCSNNIHTKIRYYSCYCSILTDE